MVVEAAVEALHVGIAPGLAERNKDHLNAKVQTEPCELAEGPWVVEAAAEARLVVDLEKTGFRVFFPVIYYKLNDALGCLGQKLVKIGLAGKDIHAVHGDDPSVPADIARRDQIQFMKLPRMIGPDVRVVDLGFRRIDRRLAWVNKIVAFENTVDRGRVRLETIA